MKKLLTLAALGMALATGSVYAADGKATQQEKMKTCNADAKEKNLAGDERKAFMKGCLSNAPKNTAQQEKMKTCNASAKEKGLKGQERKKHMSECLKG